MKRSFMHFAYMPEGLQEKQTETPEEIADKINKLIDDMFEKGKTSGSIVIEVPDELNEEEAMQFIDEILKRLSNMDDDE